jgi:hypothetical protein
MTEPDGRRTIYVLSYPKAGGTWLARLLGDALDCPVGATVPDHDEKCIAHEGDERPGPYHVRHGHSIPVSNWSAKPVLYMGELAWRALTDEAIIYMVRDPRDLILSVAHHWDMGYTQAMMCMAKGQWPVHHGGGLERHVRAWLHGARFPFMATSYESLSTDPAAEVARLTSVYGIPVDPDRLAGAVERQSFAARKAWTEQHGDGLAYGKSFQLRFLRRGIVGAWRDELPRDLWPRVQQYWGRLMVDLGYTTGPEWMEGA